MFKKLFARDRAQTELEKILNNKNFEYSIKNIIFSLFYKIENIYDDFQKVNILVLPKDIFLNKFLNAISEIESIIVVEYINECVWDEERKELRIINNEKTLYEYIVDIMFKSGNMEKSRNILNSFILSEKFDDKLLYFLLYINNLISESQKEIYAYILEEYTGYGYKEVLKQNYPKEILFILLRLMLGDNIYFLQERINEILKYKSHQRKRIIVKSFLELYIFLKNYNIGYYLYFLHQVISLMEMDREFLELKGNIFFEFEKLMKIIVSKTKNKYYVEDLLEEKEGLTKKLLNINLVLKSESNIFIAYNNAKIDKEKITKEKYIRILNEEKERLMYLILYINEMLERENIALLNECVDFFQTIFLSNDFFTFNFIESSKSYGSDKSKLDLIRSEIDKLKKTEIDSLLSSKAEEKDGFSQILGEGEKNEANANFKKEALQSRDVKNIIYSIEKEAKISLKREGYIADVFKVNTNLEKLLNLCINEYFNYNRIIEFAKEKEEYISKLHILRMLFNKMNLYGINNDIVFRKMKELINLLYENEKTIKISNNREMDVYFISKILLIDILEMKKIFVEIYQLHDGIFANIYDEQNWYAEFKIKADGIFNLNIKEGKRYRIFK